MKKIFYTFFAAALPLLTVAQKVTGKLAFQQGQVFIVTMDVKNKVGQEAMGNNIDFNVDGTATHSFKVTNTTEDNHTLHHDVKKITFKFDGMGQNRSFDSDNAKDMEGFFGAPVKDLLGKSYDMIIDPTGKTMIVKPEKIELAKYDDRLAIVFNMLKDVTSVVYPPKKNEASFFKALPDTAVGINDTWSEIIETENGKVTTVYKLSAITDSVIIIDLAGRSSSITKSEMMGMPMTTSMNNNFTGKIIADKATGIIREKTITTESKGSTEAMGGNMPVTAKTTITITVKPAE
ncbi:MAG: hypothetical protein JNN00_14495 [Chitinophagaceae bacterium]|nr:hypothetical protein [Chitinophagaceae bacterium]